MEDEKVLIVGASGDLGAAVARDLARSGRRVVLHAGSNARVLEDLASEVAAEASVVSDLTTAPGLDALDETLSAHGTFTGLVFAAGTNPTAETFDKIPSDLARRIFDVNLWAAWNVASLVKPYLDTRKASMVLVSSVFGAHTPARRSAYGAAKHAVIGLVQAIAQEEGGAVRANAVLPGPMWSENVRRVFREHAERENLSIDDYVATRAARIPGRRFVTVEECARVVRFLISTDSTGINGQAILVDRGES